MGHAEGSEFSWQMPLTALSRRAGARHIIAKTSVADY